MLLIIFCLICKYGSFLCQHKCQLIKNVHITHPNFPQCCQIFTLFAIYIWALFCFLQAKIDGIHTEEVPGFPEVEDESEGTDIIIRLPAFSSSATFGLFVKQDRRSPQQVKDDIRRINNSKRTNDKQLNNKQLNVVHNNDISIQMRSATSGKQGNHEYSSFNFKIICMLYAIFVLCTQDLI